jgi:hypothetical protein
MDLRSKTIAAIFLAVLAAVLAGIFYVFTTEFFVVKVGAGIWWFALVLTVVAALAVAAALTSGFHHEARWQRVALLLVSLVLIVAAVVLGVMFRPFDPANIRLGAILGGPTLDIADASLLPAAPLEMSWSSAMPPVGNQGSCNSCWAYAAAAVLSARANMKSGWKSDDGHQPVFPSCLGYTDVARVDTSGWQVSPQALVDADKYDKTAAGNIGKCLGSYGQQGLLLAARGVLGADCVPSFSSSSPSCATACGAPTSAAPAGSGLASPVCTHAGSYEWRSCPAASAPGAAAPGAAGGRLVAGPVSWIVGEDALKREIAARGPVICLVNFYTKPNGALAGWTLADDVSIFGGPASSMTSPSYIARPAGDGAAYTKSFADGAHAVTVHGFGTSAASAGQAAAGQAGVPFWHIRNSWGTQWGASGDSKIERGVDAWNIESYCYAATPL